MQKQFKTPSSYSIYIQICLSQIQMESDLEAANQLAKEAQQKIQEYYNNQEIS